MKETPVIRVDTSAPFDVAERLTSDDATPQEKAIVRFLMCLGIVLQRNIDFLWHEAAIKYLKDNGLEFGADVNVDDIPDMSRQIIMLKIMSMLSLINITLAAASNALGARLELVIKPNQFKQPRTLPDPDTCDASPEAFNALKELARLDPLF